MAELDTLSVAIGKLQASQENTEKTVAELKDQMSALDDKLTQILEATRDNSVTDETIKKDVTQIKAQLKEKVMPVIEDYTTNKATVKGILITVALIASIFGGAAGLIASAIKVFTPQ